MAFGAPPAYMGFVGYAQFDFPGEVVVVRATSADIKLSQDVTKPELIDGRFDKSVYQLGPKIVEGTIEYPAIMERVAGGNLDPAARLYSACVGRETSGPRFGQLKNINLFDLSVRYTTQFATFKYKNCLVNTWKYSIAQSDVVKINCGLMGLTRENATTVDVPFMTPTVAGYPEMARIVTWNDAIVSVVGGGGAPSISGDYVRSFEVTVDNHADRYYTLNGQLFPQDIAVKKRDIDGRLVLLGRHEQLAEHAATNQDRCFEDSQVQFGYKLTRHECNSTFLVTLPQIVFRIEELALTNDVFETTVQWHSLPNILDLTAAAYLETGGTVS